MTTYALVVAGAFLLVFALLITLAVTSGTRRGRADWGKHSTEAEL